MAINQYGKHGKTAMAILGLAVATLTACAHSQAAAPPPVERPSVVDINGRLVGLQEAIEALRQRQLCDPDDAKTTRRAVAKSAAADFERRLKALTQYVKEVERSIARIDAALSSPDVLAKKLELQKKALVNR